MGIKLKDKKIFESLLKVSIINKSLLTMFATEHEKDLAVFIQASLSLMSIGVLTEKGQQGLD